MKDIKFILDRIYRGWSMNSYQYNKENQLQYYAGNSYHEKDRIEPGQQLRISLKESFHKGQAPIIHTEEDMVYHMAFLDEEENMYIFGPASPEPLTFSQLHSYRHRHHISIRDFGISCLSIPAALTCLSAAYYMVTGIQMDEQVILRQNQQLVLPSEKELFEYQLGIGVQEKGHMAYAEELKWLSGIENGIAADRVGLSSNEIEEVEKVGILAQNDNLKQTEYMVISAICLATRAAIRGGVSASEAYSLSETYYQKIAKCKNAIDILNLYHKAISHFTERVRANKNKRSAYYVEQCKDYITRHYHHKFSLQQLADELGMSYGYLSRKFSEETGMTMTQYLIKKRLEAAANLLKYSETKISTISDYLCFNSQSHFGELFKKQYQVTPLEYRRKNKIIDFTTSDIDLEFKNKILK